MGYNMKIYLLFLVIGYCSADYCQTNFTVGELPEGLLTNIIKILLRETITADCNDISPADPNNIKILLWNRENPDSPILLDKTNPSQLDTSKPTQILIHGWVCSSETDGIPQLKNGYLKRYDSNVIAVDWSVYSVEAYGDSFCRVTQVAQIVAAFICTSKLNTDNIHIVGHSMGGQMAGLIGKEVIAQCNVKIRRITALDPAGPVFQTQPASKRLEKTDANTVDVIHSNQGVVGYYGDCGTTDFYPNCGTIQPGCLQLNSIHIPDLLHLPVAAIICHHLRSVDYMIESIQSDSFKGKSSSLMPNVCVADILHQNQAVMGEDCAPVNPSSHYILGTNSEPPYARG